MSEELTSTNPRKVAQMPDIRVPLAGNELLGKALKAINENLEIKTLWRVININAIDRLGMSDHGPVHFQIVANIAMKLSRLMVKSGVEMSITTYYALSHHYAEVVILLASLLHDLGMSISREGHEEFSLFLANELMHKLLDFLPVDERTIVISETLHAIIAHRSGGKPYTIEAGLVRVADALDMSEGRSRIPYEAGNVDIFSLSAAAIDKVEILAGEPGGKPVAIHVRMNNSAGLFQVDELLRKKLKGSGIEKYVKVRATVERDQEKSLVKEFEI
jgi:uncharacterized protein